jgi:hypothetical protein
MDMPLTCIDAAERRFRGHTGRVTGYLQRRPHAVPASLDELDGPTHGVLALPHRLGWTGRQQYDVDDPADLAVLYERVLVEALNPADLRLLNAVLLRQVWAGLFLPAAVRQLWQGRLPDLAAAA